MAGIIAYGQGPPALKSHYMPTTTVVEEVFGSLIEERLNLSLRVRVLATRQAARQVVNRARAKNISGGKRVKVYQPVATRQEFIVRPIDLLWKIGRLTTPAGRNFTKLSSSWATLRYFWAIGSRSRGSTLDMCLTNDARNMDFHQKTLMSEEIGVGLAGLFVDRCLGAGRFVHTSAAVTKSTRFGKLWIKGKKSPDYIMWGPDTPYFIVECKGSMTYAKTETITQLAKGTAQVKSLRFRDKDRFETLVIGSHLGRLRTTLYVIDPPARDKSRSSENEADSFLRHLPSNVFEIQDSAAFSRQVELVERSQLMNWAGWYDEASRLAKDAGLRESLQESILPQSAPEVRDLKVARYIGISANAFPEIPGESWRVFRGVDERLLDRVEKNVGTISDAPIDYPFAGHLELPPKLECWARWHLFVAGEELVSSEGQMCTLNDVRERLTRARDKLLQRDADLFHIDVNERTLTHKLAEYLQAEFEAWNVDCEYNRHGRQPKRLHLEEARRVRIDDTDGLTVYPDIIIHHRRKEENLLVIEAKKSTSTTDNRFDRLKLDSFREELQYRFSVLLTFRMGGNPDVIFDIIERA